MSNSDSVYYLLQRAQNERGRASGSADPVSGRALKQEQLRLTENDPDQTARESQIGTRDPSEKTQKARYHGGGSHEGTPFGTEPQALPNKRTSRPDSSSRTATGRGNPTPGPEGSQVHQEPEGVA